MERLGCNIAPYVNVDTELRIRLGVQPIRNMRFKAADVFNSQVLPGAVDMKRRYQEQTLCQITKRPLLCIWIDPSSKDT